MAGCESYWSVYSAYRERDNHIELFSATLKKISDQLNLQSATSCLTIGPGDGLCKVQFIRQCAPNISDLTAVEPDHDSVEHLRARLAKSLPSVDSQVVESDLQSWKGPDNPVDVVLVFHVLYYVSASERRELFKKLRGQWLAPGGSVVVVSASDPKSTTTLFAIYDRLGTLLLPWEVIEEDLTEAGLIKRHAYEMRFVRDLSNADERLLCFFQGLIRRPITINDVRNAVEDLYPDDGKADCIYLLAVFRRM